MPKRPRPAEEELQRGRRSAGLPGVGEREEWASGRGEAAPGRRLPAGSPRPDPPPYVREKTFLEASRWLRLVQQPRASAAKSCGRKVWATPTEDRAPPPVYPQALGPATCPTDDPPADHPLTVSKAVSVPARFRNVRTLGRLRKL